MFGCKCTSNSPGCSVSNRCPGVWSYGGGGGGSGETPQRESVGKVGCKKKKNVSRYSDASVLISQLSKSCSCGIKTDAVPVSDLGRREGEGPRGDRGVRWGRRENKIKKKKERRGGKNPSHRGPPIDFTCPDRRAG